MKRFREEVRLLLDGDVDEVFGHKIDKLRTVRREFQLREDEEQELLLDVLPRFDLTEGQMEKQRRSLETACAMFSTNFGP